MHFCQKLLPQFGRDLKGAVSGLLCCLSDGPSPGFRIHLVSKPWFKKSAESESTWTRNHMRLSLLGHATHPTQPTRTCDSADSAMRPYDSAL